MRMHYLGDSAISSCEFPAVVVAVFAVAWVKKKNQKNQKMNNLEVL